MPRLCDCGNPSPSTLIKVCRIKRTRGRLAVPLIAQRSFAMLLLSGQGLKSNPAQLACQSQRARARSNSEHALSCGY
jgi:hypothetical protein